MKRNDYLDSLTPIAEIARRQAASAPKGNPAIAKQHLAIARGRNGSEDPADIAAYQAWLNSPAGHASQAEAAVVRQRQQLQLEKI